MNVRFCWRYTPSPPPLARGLLLWVVLVDGRTPLRQVFSSDEAFSCFDNPRYEELLDLIWRATKYHKLDPEAGTFIERLQHLTSVYQQINIEQAHNMPVLQNEDGIEVCAARATVRGRERRQWSGTRTGQRHPLCVRTGEVGYQMR